MVVEKMTTPLRGTAIFCTPAIALLVGIQLQHTPPTRRTCWQCWHAIAFVEPNKNNCSDIYEPLPMDREPVEPTEDLARRMRELESLQTLDRLGLKLATASPPGAEDAATLSLLKSRLTKQIGERSVKLADLTRRHAKMSKLHQRIRKGVFVKYSVGSKGVGEIMGSVSEDRTVRVREMFGRAALSWLPIRGMEVLSEDEARRLVAADRDQKEKAAQEIARREEADRSERLRICEQCPKCAHHYCGDRHVGDLDSPSGFYLVCASPSCRCRFCVADRAVGPSDHLKTKCCVCQEQFLYTYCECSKCHDPTWRARARQRGN